jgi:very-short-patch-repair endonuclease
MSGFSKKPSKPDKRAGLSVAKAKRRHAARLPAGLLSGPSVVYEQRWNELTYQESTIRQYARKNRLKATPAERVLEKILWNLNGGVLCGRFHFQHVISGKWIVDFFFPEIRLAIEVDGGIHGEQFQILRDLEKDRDCTRFDITILRLSNADVFGDRECLVQKLREGWRRAKTRRNSIIGSRPMVKFPKVAKHIDPSTGASESNS